MATQKMQPKTQKTKRQSGTKKATISPSTIQTNPEEEKRRLIAEAAYFIAERRGFQGDREMDDWLRAEQEVNAKTVS